MNTYQEWQTHTEEAKAALGRGDTDQAAAAAAVAQAAALMYIAQNLATISSKLR